MCFTLQSKLFITYLNLQMGMRLFHQLKGLNRFKEGVEHWAYSLGLFCNQDKFLLYDDDIIIFCTLYAYKVIFCLWNFFKSFLIFVVKNV